MIQNFEVVKSTTMEEVYADTAPGWKVLACRAGTQDRAQVEPQIEPTNRKTALVAHQLGGLFFC